MKLPRQLADIGLTLGSVLLAILVTTLILIAVGAPPGEAYRNLLAGALESPVKLADVMTAWVPLSLASAGLLITFAAGLWNIGIEGQIVMGAVAATWAVRLFDLPSLLYIPVVLLAGMAGGLAWAVLAGVLKTHGNVHEIFGGLGLNFIAAAFTNYLIFGPWRPASRATMSGTAPFPSTVWLPNLGGLRVSPLALLAALIGMIAVYVALRGTSWGLKLKAVGKNSRASQLIGIDTTRQMLTSFAICGALAGLGGAIQTIGVYHRLIPQISGGYGYLAILVVLLAGMRTVWVPPIAFFFAAVGVGSPRLELRMQLDSSLGGVLQGTIVLFVLLAYGLRVRLAERKSER
ncbi:MAG: ABC transporter permease [Chloroflexi bacterium]|nr:ABC transporter permease [Chloroflexota bacterium]